MTATTQLDELYEELDSLSAALASADLHRPADPEQLHKWNCWQERTCEIRYEISKGSI